jgi:3-oxoacyl-[acyl-carrier-protein] synthase III
MDKPDQTGISFYEQPQVHVEKIPIGKGVPLGIECVTNPRVGIGGAYGTWGESYDNTSLNTLLEERLGESLDPGDRMNLSELGFERRQHLSELSEAEHLDLEVEVGARFLREAARASGWEPGEVQAVLIGLTGPVADDYTERIARRAGIPGSALKVSVHKACDGSVGGLHLALNPHMPFQSPLGENLAEVLAGKKVLVGGIEGLSRFMKQSRDKNALQLFGNGAGVIGIVPGESPKFLVGITREVFDQEGVLKVHMYYPHSGTKGAGKSLIEVTRAGENHIRVAGLMHEPEEGLPVDMAGPMGMVKLFVRSGVEVVRDLYGAYQAFLARLGKVDPSIAVAIVHHANLKINKLKEKHLQREGINLPMPWLLNEFGNVSAASNMIAFLRKLASLKPGDHVLIDGFGAGTYYDAMVVELGG